MKKKTLFSVSRFIFHNYSSICFFSLLRLFYQNIDIEMVKIITGHEFKKIT